MKVGWIGLGKLGLVCAMTGEHHGGYDVVGYDPSPLVDKILETRKLPYREDGADELLLKTKIRNVSVEEVVAHSDLVFLAVQTPHAPQYEGITRIPETRVDFDYTYLKTAVVQVSEATKKLGKKTHLVIISTVIPGTIDREIRPLLDPNIRLGYSPLFIAMGTCRKDYENPEFVLFGVDSEETYQLAVEYFKPIHKAPIYRCSIKSAELAKVAYNTMISTKIAFVNHLMEVCHHTGADVDEVTDAIKLAKDRLISTKYLTAGMGDGGGCHPRDNIALSWLAQKIGMTFDLPEAIMMAREKQTEFLANLVVQNRFAVRYRTEDFQPVRDYELPVVILGKAFKEETNLELGSPAILLKNILAEKGIDAEMYDPWVDGAEDKTVNPYANGLPKCFFIGTRHAVFKDYSFSPGSVVIDPWRMIPDILGVTVIRVGQNKQNQLY